MGFFRRKAEHRHREIAAPQAVNLETIDNIDSLAVTRAPVFSEKRPAFASEAEQRRPYGAHVIVFANEKGGVGKSTTAFHTCVALSNAGESVIALDLDHRQQSLTKSLRKREEMSRHLEIDFPVPDIGELHDQNSASLDELLRKGNRSHNFIVVDVAGHDSPVARHAVKLANTLVTPINDSFVDIEVLGHIDPTNLNFGVLAPFSRLVQHAMETRVASLRGPMEWVVVQNRLRSMKTMNEQKFVGALKEIANAGGFRLAPGLRERVIYRELIPFGLTLLDLPYIPKMARAHPVAEKELNTLLHSLKLPTEVPF